MRFNIAIVQRVDLWLESGVAQPPIERVLISLVLIWGICLTFNPALMELPIFAPHRSFWPVWLWAALALAAATLEFTGLTLRRYHRPHWYVRWAGLTLMTAFWAGLVIKYISAGDLLVPWLGLNAVFAWLSFLNSARLFLHRPTADPRVRGGDAG